MYVLLFGPRPVIFAVYSVLHLVSFPIFYIKYARLSTFLSLFIEYLWHLYLWYL